ncbi:hypothetical protein SASPL_105717 [Salvia splendens]|uniref:Uncharacterized protein n=1 Tax=Salvia splendens TaxID=180675 RepID=A0A8X8YLX5_SALSN|nr:hypothetical protein SASPL_105717 [Salvia splendens]
MRFNNNNYNNNNGKAVWGSGRQESYPANRFGGRPSTAGRRDGGGFHEHNMDDGEGETRQPDESRLDEPISSKLDRVLDRLDKFDAWRDDIDRRFENLDPTLSREAEPPSGFDDGDDWDYEDVCWQRSGDRGLRGRNPSGDFARAHMRTGHDAIAGVVMGQDGPRRHDLSQLPTGESIEVQDNHSETHRRSQMDQLLHDILKRGIGGAFTTNPIREPLLTIEIKGVGTIA